MARARRRVTASQRSGAKRELVDILRAVVADLNGDGDRDPSLLITIRQRWASLLWKRRADAVLVENEGRVLTWMSELSPDQLRTLFSADKGERASHRITRQLPERISLNGRDEFFAAVALTPKTTTRRGTPIIRADEVLDLPAEDDVVANSLASTAITVLRGIRKQVIERVWCCPCGQFFVSNRPHQKFCSTRCQQDFRPKRDLKDFMRKYRQRPDVKLRAPDRAGAYRQRAYRARQRATKQRVT